LPLTAGTVIITVNNGGEDRNMTRLRNEACPVVRLCVFLALLASPAALLRAAEAPQSAGRKGAAGKVCKVLADKRVQGPLQAIANEYSRRSGDRVSLEFLSAAAVNAMVKKGAAGRDVAICMAAKTDKKTPVSSLPGAKKVVWKHPGGHPVWAAVLTKDATAAGFARFVGGPTGHRLWSESEGGFIITTGKTHAEAFDWVVRNRIKHTYPLTAMRMMAEIGGIREGICVDVGCGTGNLDVELARRSNFKIIGLDIDPDMKPLFAKRIREAGLEKRVSFVVGDAQKMPFADNYADVIISRGTLTFIPDIPKCLREVHRVLKPTGVAFLGGRYVYTPRKYKISTEKLKKLVRDSGVPGAKVVDQRGQWVKIVGPKAPKAAHKFQGGPHMLANRFIADYAITKGKCLLICRGDGGLEQALQRGFLRSPDLHITAMYRSERQAGKRIHKADLSSRITCTVGRIGALPFDEGSFDLVAGVGPVLIWEKDKAKAMREIYRVLRLGGAALVGGKYLHMPSFRRVSSETLRKSAAKTGISSIRVYDDMGQWVEVRKGIRNRGFCD